MAWSESKTAKLARLWKTGNTSGEIAVELGMSRSAVIGKLNRLRLIGDMTKAARLERIRRSRHTILSIEMVREIRVVPKPAPRGHNVMLAKKFNCAIKTIASVRCGYRWAWA